MNGLRRRLAFLEAHFSTIGAGRLLDIVFGAIDCDPEALSEFLAMRANGEIPNSVKAGRWLELYDALAELVAGTEAALPAEDDYIRGVV